MVSLRNNVNMIGRMSRDPELRKTNSDIPVVNFSLAVDRPGTSRDNRITDFFDCVAWRQTAETITKYFKQGDPVGIHGCLTTNERDKDGQKIKKIEIQVDSFEFMPTKKQQTEQAQPEQANDTIPEPAPVNTDNLPF